MLGTQKGTMVLTTTQIEPTLGYLEPQGYEEPKSGKSPQRLQNPLIQEHTVKYGRIPIMD